MNRPQETPPGDAGGDQNPDRPRIRWQSPASKKPDTELTDELVLCCLDPTTWRPIVRPRIIGLGLAACVVGQLIAFGKVNLVDKSLVLSYTAQPPNTVLMLEVWEAVKAEHTAQPVKTWLQYLAEQGMGSGGIFARVAERMASRGLVTIERQGILGRRLAYAPTNPSAAAWPFVRLRQGLNREDLTGPNGRDAFLIGLLSRMGLEPRLADADLGRHRLEAVDRGLEPPIRKLLGHLDVVVGEAAMTQRS
ncbi:GOLPH3/VPS74 family protein [Glycomyces xiaoerkulensis]|uniref:GOLPH3/VPS74 family protein n=1 Tax=Glycomyces xiaoerkulensis TaxID=2038139 RepID=UPI000C25CBDD|nr:GPP34 family phosphoprotein [Glycomyces xiaoerkulensis]